MSNTVIARFNIHIQKSISVERLTEWQDALHNAALEGCGEDPEVFFEEKTEVLGVSIAVEDSGLSLLEAGSALGHCEVAYEQFGEYLGPTWFSLHASDESVIASPYTP